MRIAYAEGAGVGYRRYLEKRIKPLFPFGFGLSYSEFKYSNVTARGGSALEVTVEVENLGDRESGDIPQLYLASIDGTDTACLLGFHRVVLKPVERTIITLRVDSRLLAHYHESRKRWEQKAGAYKVCVGHYAGDASLSATVVMPRAIF